jgi:hypothetical protein
LEAEELGPVYKCQGCIQNSTLKMTQQGWQWFSSPCLSFSLFPSNLRAMYSALLESFSIQGPKL